VAPRKKARINMSKKKRYFGAEERLEREKMSF
jgi:hypothetical protein